MVYVSPFSTHGSNARTPLHLQMSSTSSAWSEISMGNCRNTVDFRTPPPAYREIPAQASKRAHGSNLQNLYKAACLTILIMYVGRWSTTENGTRRDGSFPGRMTWDGESRRKNISAGALLPPQLDTSSAEPISLLAQVDDDEYIVLPNATSLVTPKTEHGHDANDEAYHANSVQREEKPQRKMLEILTDMPGSMTGRNRRKHHMDSSMASGILGGVMGWEYLIGEMFGSDHISIGMDGMCLMQDCIGGRGSPAGLADVFFQSGPLGTEQYGQPWLFQAYTPQIIVLNVGNADWESFQMYNEEYNMTIWELSLLFEESYVSLIRAIRTFAYPADSPILAESSQYDHGSHDTAAIPIFVMRPFRGQLEQATHSVVDRLRFEGDKSVFWLDTSGWLNTHIDFEGPPEDQDFFLDEESAAKEWRLTERGNQRVAILLHLHVCQYLALDTDRCAFLAPEVYEGKAVNPDAMRFEEYMRDEKERRLKKIF
ncbi:Mpv17 PMP22 protein [Rutstroemia sp. NJR-2017a BBW]|nr:Mpv17 PMP22 protein [Rutstroemia sp. NJR-2017a BBW]